jgi:predicted membrane protein
MRAEVNKKKITGYIMAIIGIIIILYNAINYIFGWKLDTPIGVIGIVLLAVGMGPVRKSTNASGE